MFPYSFLYFSFCLSYVQCVAGLTFNAIYNIRAIACGVMFGCMIHFHCFRFDFTLFVEYFAILAVCLFALVRGTFVLRFFSPNLEEWFPP